MKNSLIKSSIVVSSFLLLAACKPGPVTLGGSSHPMPVETKTGKVIYTNYHVDKKRLVDVPVGLKGSDLITAKISAAYAQDPILSASKINVSTHRGVVKLTGQVDNNQMKKYAIKVARYTKGVLAVDAKDLTIKSPS